MYAPRRSLLSQDSRWDELDTDGEKGVIRSVEHPFSKDGGLAVLKGNIALDGCIVKTAGVDESILKFNGPARVFESQDAAVKAILSNEINAGDVVVIRYEGPQRRPRHAGNALSDELPEVEGPRQSLRAGHRRPLLRRHLGPLDRSRLAGSGPGRRNRPCSAKATLIDIDIPNRTINLVVDPARSLSAAAPQQDAKGWQPAEKRKRNVTTALQGLRRLRLVGADKGAVRHAAGVNGAGFQPLTQKKDPLARTGGSFRFAPG